MRPDDPPLNTGRQGAVAQDLGGRGPRVAVGGVVDPELRGAALKLCEARLSAVVFEVLAGAEEFVCDIARLAGEEVARPGVACLLCLPEPVHVYIVEGHCGG